MTNVKGASRKAVINGQTELKWTQLFAQVRTDKKLKKRLIEAPAAVLLEHGLEVPAGMEIRVVENTDKVTHLTLPALSKAGELSEDELTQVSGGFGPLLGAAAMAGAIGFGYMVTDIVLGKTGTLKGLSKDLKKPTTPPK